MRESAKTVTAFFEAVATTAGQAPEVVNEIWARVAHPDIVYVEDPQWPGAGEYRGLDEVARCWSAYDDLLGDSAELIVELVEPLGDSVFALVRATGRTREAQVPFDHTWGYRCRMTEGLVSYLRAYLDPEAAREAAAGEGSASD